MTSVAKEVKKALNEELSEYKYDKIPEDAGFADKNGEVYAYDGEPKYK